MGEAPSNAGARPSQAQGRCALHAERGAAGICDRCGSYYCDGCVKRLGGKTLCASCLAIPGVDYLEETWAKAWGKRDGWVWYFGALGTLGLLPYVLGSVLVQRWAVVLSGSMSLALVVSYFLLKPWARKALFGLIPLYALNNLALFEEGPGSSVMTAAMRLAVTAPGALISGLFIAAAYFSTRNRLAFKVPVSDAELARYYDSHVSNPSARRAFAYGLLSIPFCVLAPVAVVFAVLGARHCDPDAWPPRGGRGFAATGMILGLVGIVECIVLANLIIR